MKKFFQKKHPGSALLIGLFVTLFLSIFVTSFLEKALRLGQSVKSIEQSTQAYYFATSIIEEQLQANTELRKKPWNTKGASSVNSFTGSVLNVFTGGTMIPEPGHGNSRYDSSWNIISMDRPVQIVLNNDNIANFSTVKFYFRIPKIDNKIISPSPSNGSGVIYFSVGNSQQIFYLKSSDMIKNNEIKQSDNNDFFTFSTKNGIYYNPSNISGSSLSSEKDLNYFIQNEVSTKCGSGSGNDYLCTFKISMLNPVIADNGNIIPFLEYKIEHINGSVPLQFMDLNAQGYAGKLLRTRNVQIPQITTNTALDFAVLQ